jgi:hypothetical protein
VSDNEPLTGHRSFRRDRAWVRLTNPTQETFVSKSEEGQGSSTQGSRSSDDDDDDDDVGDNESNLL